MTRACIFDLDGTLVDNMDLHARSFAVFVERHGLPPYGDEVRARCDGKRNRDIFPILFGRSLPDEVMREYSIEKETYYREVSAGVLRPLPGLVEFLDRLATDDVPFGIATSAPAPNVEHTLREIGLEDRFEVIVRSDEVPRGKPHPDVFLEAARRLGVAPEACAGYEDSPAGIRAVVAAGMTAVGVTTTFGPGQLDGAHRTIIDYTAER